jgi:hypothetical protein
MAEGTPTAAATRAAEVLGQTADHRNINKAYWDEQAARIIDAEFRELVEAARWIAEADLSTIGGGDSAQAVTAFRNAASRALSRIDGCGFMGLQ